MTPGPQHRDTSPLRAHWRIAPRRCLQLLAAVALPWGSAVSCGGATPSNPGTDPSPNWLKSCAGDTECDPGSTCSCGRCTRECALDAECADLADVAVCGATSGRCVEERLCMPAARGELGSVSAPSANVCSHPAEDYVLGAPALCFGRELAECPPGSEAFVDSCGCGCSTAPDYPRRCRSQCELAAGSCADLGFEEMPDYASTLSEWSNGLEPAVGVAEGECSNGRRFLFTANGTTSEARFFTSEGAFLGLSTSTDDIERTCWGESYWPEPVRCERATITRVVNRGLGADEEGQVVSLPWAEGPPEPFF